MIILLVDHSLLELEAFAASLNLQPNLSVVGEVSNLDEVLEQVQVLSPDLVLFACISVNDEILNTIRNLLFHEPRIKVVLLGCQATDKELFAAIQAGVMGFFLKDISTSKLVAALWAVENGEYAFPRQFFARVIKEYLRVSKMMLPNNDTVDTGPHSMLSKREVEVLKLLGSRVSNKEIAQSLCISENTARAHIRNILEKLHMANRNEVSDFARRVSKNIEN